MLQNTVFLLFACCKYARASMEEFTIYIDQIQEQAINDTFNPSQIEEIMIRYNHYPSEIQQEIFASNIKLPQQIADAMSTQRMILINTDAILQQLDPSQVQFPAVLFKDFFTKIHQDINGNPIHRKSQQRILDLVRQKLVTNISPYAMELWHRIRKLETMRQSGWFPFPQTWEPKKRDYNGVSSPVSSPRPLLSPLNSPSSHSKFSSVVTEQDQFIFMIQNFPSQPVTIPMKYEIHAIIALWYHLEPRSRREIEWKIQALNHDQSGNKLEVAYPQLLGLQKNENEDTEDLFNAWREYIYLYLMDTSDDQILSLNRNELPFYKIVHPTIKHMIKTELRSIQTSIKSAQKFQDLIQRNIDPDTNPQWNIAVWSKIEMSKQNILHLFQADRAVFDVILYGLLRKSKLLYESGVFPLNFVELFHAELHPKTMNFIKAVMDFPSQPFLVAMEYDIYRIKQLWSEITVSDKEVFCKIMSQKTPLDIDKEDLAYCDRLFLALLGVDEIPEDTSMDDNPEAFRIKLELGGLVKAHLSVIDDKEILEMDSLGILPQHLQWIEHEELQKGKQSILVHKELENHKEPLFRDLLQ